MNLIMLVAGFVLGFIVATVGVTGIVNMADNGVVSAKETLQQQSSEASVIVQNDAQ